MWAADTWEGMEGGNATFLVLTDGLETSMATTEIEAEIGAAIEADVDQDGIAAEIDQSPKEAEI